MRCFVLWTMPLCLAVPFLCSGQQAAGQELHKAAEVGDLERVRALLDHGAEVEHMDCCDRTPLFFAIDNGHEAITQLLLAEGAVVNHVDKLGRTALFRAASRGHKAVVQLLLAEGAVVNHVDKLGRTALFQAAYTDRESIVWLLLAHDACLPDNCKTVKRQAFIAKRGKAVGAFLGYIEEAHGLPRDVTRLIGRFAAGLPKEELPSAEY